MTKLFLANPYHDKLGRFATAAQTIGTISGLAGFAINAGLVGPKIKQLQKAGKLGNPPVLNSLSGKSISKFRKANVNWNQKVSKELSNVKLISKKVGGKNIEVSYGTIQRAGKTLTAIGIAGRGAAALTNLGLYMSGYQQTGGKTYQQRAQQARANAEREWAEREKRGKTTSKTNWPKGATDADFKKMFREASKKAHPDVGGSTQKQQKVNAAYSNKDWAALHDLLLTLSEYLSGLVSLENKELDTTPLIMFGMLLNIFKTGLENGSEYFVFPSDGPVEGFVTDEEFLIIDAITAQYMLDLFGEQK